MGTRILIAGYFGFGNTGDEAILAGMLHDLRSQSCGLDFTVVSGDPGSTMAAHGTAAVSWQDLPGLVEACQQSDLVVLGGGGLFHDYWPAGQDDVLAPGLMGQASYAGIPLLAAMTQKRCMLYAIGVGPLRDRETRRLAADAFNLADLITVRDRASYEAVVALLDSGASPSKVRITSDPAFNAPICSSTEADSVLKELSLIRRGPLIGVCLRHWDFGVNQAVWERSVAQALDLFLAETDGHAVFVPFQRTPGSASEDDFAVARHVLEHMRSRERATAMPSVLTSSFAAGVLSRFDAVLAMRMHAALFALRAGVPVVSLSYDPKVSALMDAAGLAEFDLELGALRDEGLGARLVRAVSECDREAEAEFAQRMSALATENARLCLRLAAEPAGLPERAAARVSAFALRRTLQYARRANDSAWNARIREERDRLLDERDRLARDLARLNANPVVRLMGATKDAGRRLLPPGGAARERYYLLMAFLRRAARDLRIRPSPRLGALGSGPNVPKARLDFSPELAARYGLLTHDATLDLIRFKDRVAAGAASMVVTLFSPTQLIESEGQRPTNFALELSRRGVPVIFAYWRWDQSEWTEQDRLRDGIFQIPIDIAVQRPRDLFSGLRGLPRLVLFGFPHPDFFGPLAVANSEGWITAYDVHDDWEAFKRVGQAHWYDGEFERHLVNGVDAVFAVNDHLAAKACAWGRTDVAVVPNGYRPGVETAHESRAMERGQITVGYFGHLTDGWFDWRLVTEVARSHPSWGFVLVGYGQPGANRRLPDNIVLAGKVPQSALADYAAEWDVGIVPFKPGELARGADPIKVYEYLAMGLPVVATGITPPPGAERHVLLASGVTDFAEKIEIAMAGSTAGADERKAYAAGCTWAHRVDAVLGLIARGGQRVAEKRALSDWNA